jgi:hypothetical protein
MLQNDGAARLAIYFWHKLLWQYITIAMQLNSLATTYLLEIHLGASIVVSSAGTTPSTTKTVLPEHLAATITTKPHEPPRPS